MISILGYVLLGILLVTVILPALDALMGCILTMLEVVKGYFSVKVAQYNSQLKKVAYGEEDEMIPKRLIGFTIEQEDEETDEDL